MKKAILLVCFLCSVAALPAQPALHFAQTEQNAGTIPARGEAVVREYAFTNTGDEPLVITGAATTCSCTKVTYPKKPILPGEGGTIIVRYDPRKQLEGQVYKTIQVYSNDPAGRSVILFRGEVK